MRRFPIRSARLIHFVFRLLIEDNEINGPALETTLRLSIIGFPLIYRFKFLIQFQRGIIKVINSFISQHPDKIVFSDSQYLSTYGSTSRISLTSPILKYCFSGIATGITDHPLHKDPSDCNQSRSFDRHVSADNTRPAFPNETRKSSSSGASYGTARRPLVLLS